VSEDALLMACVQSAVDFVEGHSGLRLISQQWDYTVDRFPDAWRSIRLPLAPLISVDQVVYVDTLGSSLTLDPSTYLVRGVGSVQPGQLVLAPNKSWPATWCGIGAATIRATYGFGSDWNSVPHDVRQSIGMLAGYWYGQREAAQVDPDARVFDVPFSVKQILEPYRVWAI
jgi:uncharacterized phiE125 gp8 family phage protein